MYTLLDLHDKYNALLRWAGLISVYHHYAEIEKLKQMHRALSEFLIHLEAYAVQINGPDYLNDINIMIDNIRIIRNHVKEHYEQLIEV
jgi:hypothetical protein